MLTLSKPPLMSRKRVVPLRLAIWRVLILWVRVGQALKVDRPAREPDLWDVRRLTTRATHESLLVIIRSSILEKVWRRTMTLKEEGEA